MTAEKLMEHLYYVYKYIIIIKSARTVTCREGEAFLLMDAEQLDVDLL